MKAVAVFHKALPPIGPVSRLSAKIRGPERYAAGQMQRRIRRAFDLIERDGNPERVGVEWLHNPEDPVAGDTDDYWRLVREEALRRKIELVPLEPPSHRHLTTFEGNIRANQAEFMKREALSKKRKDVPGTKESIIQLSNAVPESFRDGTANRAKKMLAETALAEGIDSAKLWEIINAVSRSRSFDLHEAAEKEGLSHILVGRAHALDLALEKRVQAVTAERGRLDLGEAIARRQMHEKHAELVSRLRRIAQG